MRSTIGIDIEAPPGLVFAVVHDVTRWERLLPHYVRSTAERPHRDGSITCRFVARRPLIDVLGFGLPVAWRSRVSHDAATRRIRFRHLGGATDGMDVTWHIEPAGAGTRVDIEHEFERGPRDVLPALIERFFTRAIAGRTLATFESIAETLHEAGAFE